MLFQYRVYEIRFAYKNHYIIHTAIPYALALLTRQKLHMQQFIENLQKLTELEGIDEYPTSYM